MRGRLLTVALAVCSLGLVGVTVAAATPEAVPEACALPAGGAPCMSDPECTQYGAICDVQAGACVCAGSDMGTLVGDLAMSDGGGGAGGGGGGGSPGTGSGVPTGGGGMTGPPKTGGCSFAPGSRGAQR